MDLGEDTSLILLDLSAALRSYYSIIPSFSLVIKISLGLDWFNLDWLSSHLPSCSQSVSINDSTFHLSISVFSLLWCTPRFRTGSTPFHSLYNSSWLFDLKNPSNIMYADTLMKPSCTKMCTSLSSFTSTNSALFLESPPLSLTFSHG